MEATMQSTAQANVQLVQKIFRLFGEGNIPALLNELTDDIIWILPGPKTIPWAGVYEGKQGVVEFFTRMGGNYEFQKFEPREFFAQGDRVVVLGYNEATPKSTGKQVKEEWVMTLTIKNGKVSHFQEYNDTWKRVLAFS
jgi:ketosteroid isomerase-like protein